MRVLKLRLASASVLAMLCETLVGQTQLPYPSTLHVNPETGSDSPLTPGTLAQPLASVNEALQRAHDANGGAIVIDTIKVYASAVPVAPSGFGVAAMPGVPGTEGKEAFGWKSSPTDPDEKPFPIRMQAGVSIIGVSAAAVRPRILIDEKGEGLPYTNWAGGPFDPDAEPGTVSDFWCIVAGASNSTLQGFEIDGSLLASPHVSWWPAVYGTGIVNFTIADCEIHNWHDEVCLAAASGVTTRALVTGCVLRDAWPFSDIALTTGVNENDFGHAALWAAGNGTLRVQSTGTTFKRCHDGVELSTLNSGGVAFTASLCRFEDTENGVEAVGLGSISYSLDQCIFIGNNNKVPPNGGGTAFVDGSTGAIIERLPTPTTGVVRRCDFRNCAQGVLTSGTGDPTNLGISTNPGLNNFCIDFSIFASGTDPYRVMLDNRKAGTLHAEGNWWIRSNQGADASGYLTGSVSGTHLNDPPPGPQAGPFKPDNVTPWDRNFTIVGGSIVFGSAPSGTVPDCSVLP